LISSLIKCAQYFMLVTCDEQSETIIYMVFIYTII
jgi:hypothetical protein